MGMERVVLHGSDVQLVRHVRAGGDDVTRAAFLLCESVEPTSIDVLVTLVGKNNKVDVETFDALCDGYDLWKVAQALDGGEGGGPPQDFTPLLRGPAPAPDPADASPPSSPAPS